MSGTPRARRCHAEIAAAYGTHPMGRSLSEIGATSPGAERVPMRDCRSSPRGCSTPSSAARGGSSTRRHGAASDGGVFAEIEAEVRYALGSGTRGTAFLIEREGSLFQSPIAWFAHERRWDISPGYRELATRANFERPIQPGCLFCHANQFRPVAGDAESLRGPDLPGPRHRLRALPRPGCAAREPERAVGRDRLDDRQPGQPGPRTAGFGLSAMPPPGRIPLHAGGPRAARLPPGPADPSVLGVLPQEDGERRQVRGGRTRRADGVEPLFPRQPGPARLHLVSRPAPTAGAVDEGRVLPRALPGVPRTEGAAPAGGRATSRGGGERIASHATCRGSAITNIPHTAATDHRIPRGGVPRLGGGAAGRRRGSAGGNSPDGLPLGSDERGGAAGLRARPRRGPGLGGPHRNAPQPAKAAATLALPLLEAAVRDRPDDLPARESLGHAFRFLDRPEDAIRAFEEVLRIEPGRELTLRSTGRAAGRPAAVRAARSVLQKAIAVNPWSLGLSRGDGPGLLPRPAIGPEPSRLAQAAIRLNPELVAARSLLIQGFLRSHQPEKADAEFQTLLRLYPASREVWQHWYEGQRRAAQGSADSSKAR